MNDEQILEKLLEFGEYLTRGTLFNDFIRTVGWWFVLGMAWIIDTLENVADTILGLRVFLENPEIQAFVSQMQPLLIILFAFNILFIGYLLIFQKEFNRPGIFANVFMALVIVVALGSGMEQGNEFTGDTIEAINVNEDNVSGSMANQVIQNNITDVGLFDQEGWNTSEIEERNQIQSSYARDININSYLTDGSMVTSDEPLSEDGEDILGHKLITFIDGSQAVEELEDGGWITDISQEYYYRYTVDWINLVGTLAVMAVVLATVSVKLASLLFELTFNYILAPFVAASDMHSGQRMKQMIQNILNIFLVTIMIFLSLKIYLIGTEFIGSQLTGLRYLIAMIGLAATVMNGPNIVERLFGIDAGGKGGLAALAGSYAIAKGAASMGKGTMAMAMAGAGSKAAGGANGGKGEKENVSEAAKNKEVNRANNKAQNGQGQAGKGGSGEKDNVAKQAQEQGKGQQEGAKKENVAKQAEKGGATGTGQGTGSDESPKQGAGGATTIQEDMDKRQAEEGEKGGGNSRPTSLHEEMKQKGDTGTKQPNKGSQSGTGAGKGSGVGSAAASTAGAAAGSSATVAGNAASGSGQKADGATSGTGSKAEIGNEQTDQQASQTETESVSEQKQGAQNQQTKSGSGVGGASTSTAGAAGSAVSGATKSTGVRNAQQAGAGSGQVGKEIIEEENEVNQDGGGGGSVEQERRTSTSVRQDSTGGAGNVQQTTSAGGSSSGGTSGGSSGSTPAGAAAGGAGGSAAASDSRPSSGGGGQTTSTQKNTTRVTDDGGNAAPERQVIQEENETIQDSRSSSQPKQETSRIQGNTNKKEAANSYRVGSNKKKDIHRKE